MSERELMNMLHRTLIYCGAYCFYASPARCLLAVNSLAMNTRTFSGSVAIAAVLASFALVGIATAQTVQAPSGSGTATTLVVSLDTAPTVPRAVSDITLASMSLSGTHAGSMISISSIPLTITGGQGGATANLLNCKLRDPHNLNSTLTGAVSLSSGGATTFTFSSSYMVFANVTATLALACDVQPASAIGSTFTISVDPAQIIATNAATGARVSVSGGSASLSGTVIVTDSMGTGTGTGTGTSTGTPGIPNTGLGGDIVASLFVLALSGLAALGGGIFVRRSLR